MLLPLYVREQKGGDESDDLSLVRLLNNATRVFSGSKNLTRPSPEAEAPQKLNLAQCSVRDTVAELLSIEKKKKAVYF